VKPGDRIVAVDNARAADWVAQASGTDDRARRLAIWQQAYRALHGGAGSMARLQIVGPAGGATREVDVVRATEPGQVVALGNLPPLHVRTETAEYRLPRGRHAGYIAFNVWMAAVADPFAAAIDRFRKDAGLIIDLRGNPGGLAEMIRGIAGHLLDEPALLGRLHVGGAALEFRANPRRSTADGRRVEPYAGPVAILVDELTASASECFTGGLQSLGRARVFGTRTMGEALPASTRQLPNGDVLMYAVGDFVTSTGVRLEGPGVQPDEVVATTPGALAAGHDAPLEAALAWLGHQGL
jgi:carboxyl-terminal processing protease